MNSDKYIFDMESCADYLSDESGFPGSVEAVAFPQGREEFTEIIRESSGKITFQSARTGLCGASAGEGGRIINLSRMKHILGLRHRDSAYSLITEPGITLAELNEAVSKKHFDCSHWDEESLQALKELKKEKREYFFAPDPTEKTASLGGMFSVNAAGADAVCFGRTADNILGAELCLSDGSVWRIKRGEYIFNESGCTLPDGRVLNVCCANKGILNPGAGSDLLELFAGSEGMLAGIISLELLLRPRYKYRWGMVLFAESFKTALSLGRSIRELDFSSSALTAMEILDSGALSIIDGQRGGAAASVPAFPHGAGSALHLRLEGDSEDELEESLMGIMDVFQLSGADDSFSWAGTYDKDIEMFASLSHIAAESVNLLRGKNTCRLALDVKLPVSAEDELASSFYEASEAAGIRGMIFGSCAGGELHMELLPANEKQLYSGHELFKMLALKATKLGGSISFPNGVGKIKKYLLEYSRADIDKALYIKKFFDPGNKLNPGNFF